MKIIKRSGAFVVIALLIMNLFSGIIVNAYAAENGEQRYNFDVVFVVDASGTMNYADPNKLTADAVGQFMDMMDDTCRMGYVVYGHKIVSKHDLVNLSNSKGIDNVKNEINSVEYDPNNDTDISLGLTEAMKILERGEPSADRKQMIVLFSDGKTDLPKGPRTVEDSEKEMKSTLKTLKERSIRTYTIGLNCDGTLDKKTMQNIADSTGAKTFEAKKASELHGIITAIFTDYDDIEPSPEIPVEKKDVENDPNSADYIATIPVHNNSVYLANIVVNSTNGVSTPRLTNPSGFQVALEDNSQVKVHKGRTYMVVKIFSPEVGDWKLTLRGLKKDDVTFTLLESYSFYVYQMFDAKTVTANSDLKITASLNGKDGIVKDEDLISTIEAECDVKSGTGASQTVHLTHEGDGIFTGLFHVEKEGTYNFQTTIKAKNGSFVKTSKSASISAEDVWNGIMIKQMLSSDTLEAGETLDIKASLFNGENAVTDPLILAGYSAKTTITEGDVVTDAAMTVDEDGIFRGSYTFDHDGQFTVVTSLLNDASDDVKTSDTNTVFVAKTSLKLTAQSNDIDINLVSPPRTTENSLKFSNYALWSKGDALNIEFEPENSNIFKVTAEPKDNDVIFTLTGAKGGEDNCVVKITDEEGNSVQLHLKVNVENGWKPFITAGIITICVIVIGVILFLLLRSKLKGKYVTLSLTIPAGMGISTPARQDIQLPQKHSATLWEIMKMSKNSYANEALKDAIDKLELRSEMKRIKLIAKGKHKFDVVMMATNNSPAIVNSEEISSKRAFRLGKNEADTFDLRCENNGHLVIRYLQ